MSLNLIPFSQQFVTIRFYHQRYHTALSANRDGYFFLLLSLTIQSGRTALDQAKTEEIKNLLRNAQSAADRKKHAAAAAAAKKIVDDAAAAQKIVAAAATQKIADDAKKIAADAAAAKKIADDAIKVQLCPSSCYYDTFQFQFISYIDST